MSKFIDRSKLMRVFVSTIIPLTGLLIGFHGLFRLLKPFRFQYVGIYADPVILLSVLQDPPFFVFVPSVVLIVGWQSSCWQTFAHGKLLRIIVSPSDFFSYTITSRTDIISILTSHTTSIVPCLRPATC